MTVGNYPITSGTTSRQIEPAMPPIPARFQEIEKILNALGENVRELGERINPVLHPPSPPTTGVGRDTPNPVQVLPPLADMLDLRIGQIQAINDAVLRLRDRIAL